MHQRTNSGLESTKCTRLVDPLAFFLSFLYPPPTRYIKSAPGCSIQSRLSDTTLRAVRAHTPKRSFLFYSSPIKNQPTHTTTPICRDNCTLSTRSFFASIHWIRHTGTSVLVSLDSLLRSCPTRTYAIVLSLGSYAQFEPHLQVLHEDISRVNGLIC